MRVGIIGCGSIAKMHASQYYISNVDGVELTACADSFVPSLDSFAVHFGVGKKYVDPFELIRSQHVDVVDICTPPELHGELICAASAAGKDIICEKPLSLTLEDARMAVSSTEDARVKFGVVQNYRYRPEYVEAKNVISSGRIGKPLMGNIEALFHWNGGVKYRRSADRMIIIELAIHYIDLLRFVFSSDIVKVFAAAGGKEKFGAAGELFASITLFFENGAIATVINSGLCQGATANWGGEAVLQAEDGTIYLNKNGVFSFRMYSAAAGGEMRRAFSPDLYAPSTNITFTNPLGDFFRAIASGAEPPVSGRSNLNTLEATLAAYESVECGLPVNIPWVQR